MNPTLYQLSPEQLQGRFPHRAGVLDGLEGWRTGDGAGLFDVRRWEHGALVRGAPGTAWLVVSGSVERWREMERRAVHLPGEIVSSRDELRAREHLEAIVLPAAQPPARPPASPRARPPPRRRPEDSTTGPGAHRPGPPAPTRRRGPLVHVVDLGGGRLLVYRDDPRTGPAEALIRSIRGLRTSHHRVDGAGATLLCEALEDGSHRLLVRTAAGPESDLRFRLLPDLRPVARLDPDRRGVGLSALLQRFTGALADPLTPPILRMLGLVAPLSCGRVRVLELLGSTRRRLGVRVELGEVR